MILIDTDIFIDLLRGHKLAFDFFESLKKANFSAITEAELISGQDCSNFSSREKVLHLLAMYNKISVGNPIAQRAGDFRREYNVPLDDSIIAASAVQIGATLVTRNLKDFSKIKDLKIKTPY